MGDSANNEAKIVITTDPAQFVQFMTDAARAFRNLEKEGKQSVSGVDKAFESFSKGAVGMAGKVLNKVLSNAMSPFAMSLEQATQQARAWRSETTRMMGSTGQDWQKIGQQVDEAAKKVRRMPDDVLSFSDSVQELTGNWEGAQEGLKAYSDLSRYLGRQTVQEMAPLAAMMENLFGIKGANRARDFFNQAAAGAEKLGQNGRIALRQFERIAPEVGLHAPRDPMARERYMREVGAFSPAIQAELGYGPEQAELATRSFMGQFTGQNLTYFEQQLRRERLLKNGEYLKIGGTLQKSPSELYALEMKLMERHQKARGRKTDHIWKKFVEQNVPEWAQELFLGNHGQSFLARLKDGSTATGYPVDGVNGLLGSTDEAKRVQDEIRLAIRGRKLGQKGLASQDYMTHAEPWKNTDLVDADQKMFEQEQTEAAMQAGAAGFGTTGALVAGGAAKVALHVGRGARADLEQNAPTASLGGMSAVAAIKSVVMGIGSSIKSLTSETFNVRIVAGDAAGPGVPKAQKPAAITGGGNQTE